MSWNYRVFKENDYYSIREVYYDTKDRPRMYSTDSQWPGGERRSELHRDLEYMRTALKKPTLKPSDFPAAKPRAKAKKR